MTDIADVVLGVVSSCVWTMDKSVPFVGVLLRGLYRCALSSTLPPLLHSFKFIRVPRDEVAEGILRALLVGTFDRLLVGSETTSE
jgi:hypothetical protein